MSSTKEISKEERYKEVQLSYWDKVSTRFSILIGDNLLDEREKFVYWLFLAFLCIYITYKMNQYFGYFGVAGCVIVYLLTLKKLLAR